MLEVIATIFLITPIVFIWLIYWYQKRKYKQKKPLIVVAKKSDYE
ncbi:hypothetical protein [Thermoactinomyces sp. DSM 45892]|nr:hypothetical protein [Thermoactinomyces sp. DSM 45892]SDY85167.1 hypothetical protein SAMN05444416_10973 [Thermoactinomyces sp. DSM 45892]